MKIAVYPELPAAEATCTRGDLSAYLLRAMTRLGVQVKEVAFAWGVGHSYVSRVLSGQDPLPDHRVQQLPPALRVAILEEWARDEGLTIGP